MIYILIYFSHSAIFFHGVVFLVALDLFMKSASGFNSRSVLRSIVLSFYLIGFTLCGYQLNFLCCSAQVGIPLVCLVITF